jgi:hypothetical protein
LRIHLLKDGDLISAKVVRIPLKTLSSGLGDQAQWEEERDVKAGDVKGEYTLLNLLYAKQGSFLYELADYLLRVEDMSHILNKKITKEKKENIERKRPWKWKKRGMKGRDLPHSTPSTGRQLTTDTRKETEKETYKSERSLFDVQ